MRNKLLALVHIGKEQLGMDDETYRNLLSQQFYQNSAKNISYSELVKLVKLLQSKGANIQLPKTVPLTAQQRKVWVIWKQMEANGTVADGSYQVLNGFVYKQFKTAKQRKELSETATLLETFVAKCNLGLDGPI